MNRRGAGSAGESDLRSRYAATNVHHPFEKVVGAFEPADLVFLLTSTDSLKITYLADHKDLPTGRRLRQWVEYGVIAANARLASKAGYTPKTLGEAVDLAAKMGPDISREGWLEILIKHPATKRFLTSCAASGIDGPWLEAALKSGATLQLLRYLRKLQVPPRYLTASIVTGCPGARAIQEWFNAGISPWVSAQFIEAGLTAGQALSWLQAGFIPSEIVEFALGKESIEECKDRLPNVPYSKAFRREGEGQFAIAGPYVERVWRAVQALDVPSIYQSSMFSTARENTSFLDGGYVSVSGYGFGSHSYTLVRGELALRFLCYRIGVRPPRVAAKGQELPTQDSIEKLFESDHSSRKRPRASPSDASAESAANAVRACGD